MTVRSTEAAEPGPVAVSVMDVGERRAVRFVELLMTVSETVPLKPLILAMLRLVELFDPALTVKLGFTGLMLKSTPATATVVDDDNDCEVAVTLITALPVRLLVRTVSVAFCLPPEEIVTDAGVSEVTKPHAHPVADAVRVTVPLKLPTLVTVMVEFADEDVGIVRVCGLAVTMKPSTSTVTVVVLVVVPLSPVMVTMYVPALELRAVMFSTENAATH